MKKIIHFISIAIAAITICIGCSNDSTDDLDITVDDNVTSATTYTVTFDSNDGTSVAAQTVEENGSATKPSTPTKSGYTFEQWCSDEALTTEYDFTTTITANITLYAKWSVDVYKVTFYFADENSNSYSTTVEFGSSVVAPNSPSRLNYTFNGWYTAVTGGEEYSFEAIDESAIPESGTISIYAQWSEIPTVAAVYFYSAISYDGSESAFDTQYLQPDAAVPTITAPAIDYYTTDGKWYTDMACTEEYDQSTTYQEAAEMIEVKLYAKWTINTYTVTFSTDYGTAPDAITGVVHGLTVESLGTAPERTGYEFDGWCANASCTEKFTTETAVTGDITVYASWTPVIYDVVLYYNNGTEEYGTTTVAFGSAIEIITTDLTYNNYTLMGWYTAATEGEAYAFEPIGEEDIPADGTIELYAQWAITTTVNFYSAISYAVAEEAFETQYVLLGECATSVTPDEIEGYTNDGKWYTDKDCTAEYTFTETYQEGDEAVSLYAKWTINKYTITFSTEYGTAPEDITDVEHGLTVESLGTEPTVDGYDFVGWFSDESQTIEFTTSTEVTSNLKLYAKWAIGGDITVTFVYNDGDATADYIDTHTYADGTFGVATAPASVDYTDHTFIGWYSDEAMTSTYDFETELTGSIKLYAKWWDHAATDVEIGNVTELCVFRDLVNQGISTDIDVKLTADIDCSSICGEEIGNWISIAYGGTYYYSGTFDGDNHSISNLYCSETNSNLGGLFSEIGGGAVIKNVIIKDICIINTKTRFGAVVCYVRGGGATISNCTTEGGSISAGNQAGGILGACNNTADEGAYVIIENCQNLGTTITASINYAGGIAGWVGSYAAATPSTVINCYSTANVTSASFAGGILACGYNGIAVTACYNEGTITSLWGSDGSHGGIVGRSGYNGKTTACGGCVITACYNTGAVNGSKYTGGILGQTYASTGTIITSCYNTGSIGLSGAAAATSGGISGGYDTYSPTLVSNYFVDVEGDKATYGNGSGSSDEGAAPLEDIAALNEKLEAMNASCISSGYKFIEGESNPVLNAI